MKRWREASVAVLSLLLTAENPLESPEIVNAGQVMTGCALAHVKNMDDHISPANVIAEGLAKVCTNEIDAYVSLATVAMNQGPDFRAKMIRDFQGGSQFRVIVLGYRTGRIKAPQ